MEEAMFLYYVAPVVRTDAGMTVNPLSGACVLAGSPHEGHRSLGLPDAGEMFAVWVFGQTDSAERPELTLWRAGEICSQMPPHRVYACLGGGALCELNIDPLLDVRVEAGRAGAD
jgi:hypothetical protein